MKFWPPDLMLTSLKRKGRALSVFQLQLLMLVKPTFSSEHVSLAYISHVSANCFFASK